MSSIVKKVDKLCSAITELHRERAVCLHKAASITKMLGVYNGYLNSGMSSENLKDKLEEIMDDHDFLAIEIKNKTYKELKR